MLDDRDVVRLLFRDKELGVLALGVQPVGAGMAGAPHRLAVHRDRPPGAPRVPCGLQPRIQPGPDSSIQRVRAGRFQHAADGGLIRRHEPPGQRITADVQSGQDLRRRVRDPFTDRGKRPGPSSLLQFH